MRAPRRDDRGSATVWLLAACTLLLLVAVVAAARTAGVVVKHRAESAADLSALAAAGRIGVDGRMCAVAAETARRNDARLVACTPRLAPDERSGTVVTRVAIATRLPFAGTRTIAASARAARLVGQHR